MTTTTGTIDSAHARRAAATERVRAHTAYEQLVLATAHAQAWGFTPNPELLAAANRSPSCFWLDVFNAFHDSRRPGYDRDARLASEQDTAATLKQRIADGFYDSKPLPL